MNEGDELKMNEDANDTAVEKVRLSDIRRTLLDLHKALVDFERVRYGRTMGQIQSPQHLLQLLTNDPWFAWLHPISQLIVVIDEALDEREPLTRELIVALANQTRGLLVASESGDGFARQYFDALQEEPDVVFAHAAVMKILGPRQDAGQAKN